MKIRPFTRALLLAAALSGTLSGAQAHEAAPGPRSAAEEAVNRARIEALIGQLNGGTDTHRLGAWFAHDLIQHHPAIANGRHAMLNWIHQQRQLAPQRRQTIRHLIADRDMVFVHAQLSDPPANEFGGINRYDFYRLDQGQVVEYWSVEAPAPAHSASGNSAFSDKYPTPAARGSVPAEREETNRLLVRTLSEEVFGKRQFGLLDRFWAEGYLQHNPYVANGRAALAAVIEYIAPAGASYRVVRSLAADDLAVVCAQSTDPGGDPRNEFSGYAVCDLYRVDKLALVEHWDAFQPVPATSASGNSMFSALYRARR